MEIDRQRLHDHVARLTRSPRPAESAELESVRGYITDELNSSGWQVARDPFDAKDAQTGQPFHGISLLAVHPDHPLGNGPRFCVGAHMDSCPQTPGADDNASAVAALLEIARVLPQNWPSNAVWSLELAAFDLEENGMVGGAWHAQSCKKRNVDLQGMISLEMLGYCSHAENSQQLPPPLVGLYPSVGNFIALIGNQNSHPLLGAFAFGMKHVPDLPVEMLAVPDNGNPLPASRLSDHSGFWDAGYPALMITDTSFLRNPHYHMPTDTIDTLDFDFLQKVTQGCVEALRGILQRGYAQEV
jgi:Zn-dependent M28 family amino/carboxypeptidase